MHDKRIATILSFLAAICFLISYFVRKEILYLILGITWLVIALGNRKKNK